MSAKKKKEVWYLCGECAEKNGGTWDEHHLATMHVAECQVCNKRRSLACVTDWNLNQYLKPYKPHPYLERD